ncbi:MAG: GGDEF domain-containing protein [Xanthobacteraceae bacterium]|nr:GGDEF domain-containing protein [Xanthobacteraceae bacterium]
MAVNLVQASASLDFATLFVIAVCVTALLGLFLLFAWMQERIRALAWWGAAYLIGAASGALWRFGDQIGPALPSNLSTILLFVAVGLIWSAARLFHGRPVRWIAALFGAAFWLPACFVPAFASSAASRIVVSSLIVAGYTFLTAAELWRERRKSLIRRWPAAFVPMLHGAIFLFPVALAALAQDNNVSRDLARGWLALFAIEILLYAVGTAFIVLILAKDRTMRAYKMAATTDPLTGLLNRRGFFEAAGSVMRRHCGKAAPISVLVFDLDHFKSINDRCGHSVGDAVLQLFAAVVRQTMRSTDVIGRLGGEEFVTLLPGSQADAAVAAERVRQAFAAAGILRNGQHIAATVSIGIACGSPSSAIDLLIARADTALYRAKTNGRDRVETAAETADSVTEQHYGEHGDAIAHRKKEKEESAANNGALESCIA